jgi:hypothetical protein
MSKTEAIQQELNKLDDQMKNSPHITQYMANQVLTLSLRFTLIELAQCQVKVAELEARITQLEARS